MSIGKLHFDGQITSSDNKRNIPVFLCNSLIQSVTHKKFWSDFFVLSGNCSNQKMNLQESNLSSAKTKTIAEPKTIAELSFTSTE